MKYNSAIILTFLILSSFLVKAQDSNINDQKRPRVIQFTGVIFSSDSNSVIPGVHIYVPKGGRGTTSNPYGYFSMPVLEGDSIIFSSVGFKRTYFIVPEHKKDQSLKRIIYLKEDVKYLNEVEVFPFPSEATFKAAVLASEMPNKRAMENLDAWVNSDYLDNLYFDVPASPNENYRVFMERQMNYQIRRAGPQANPLLNPFAWRNFIRSLKGN